MRRGFTINGNCPFSSRIVRFGSPFSLRWFRSLLFWHLHGDPSDPTVYSGIAMLVGWQAAATKEFIMFLAPSAATEVLLWGLEKFSASIPEIFGKSIRFTLAPSATQNHWARVHFSCGDTNQSSIIYVNNAGPNTLWPGGYPANLSEASNRAVYGKSCLEKLPLAVGMNVVCIRKEFRRQRLTVYRHAQSAKT